MTTEVHVVRRVYRGGRVHDLFSDGTVLPVVSGGDGPVTAQDLRDERGRVLTAIDDILETARSEDRAELSDEERENHDLLEWRAAELDQEIVRAETSDGDAMRFERHDQRRAAPGVNRIDAPPPSANRSLDELLWATAEEVPSGSLSKAGQFISHFGARAAVEQVAVRSEDGDAVLAPRIDEFRPEDRGAIRSFQRTVADMCLFGLMVDKSAHSSADAFEAARSHRLMRPRWEQACRAMDVDTAGEGGTWVPTGIGAVLHERVRALGKVAPLFTRIDLPTNPWKWPIEGADATAFRVAEPTTDTETKPTASTPGTVAATYDAEILGGRVLFSRSIEADSALAILPYTQSKLVTAFVTAEERAVIDGDTDGAHQDSDVGASVTDARTSWDGLRKRGLANTNVDGGSVVVSLALFRQARAAMAKWGLNPADLAVITSIGVYYDLLGLPEVTTIDKLGPLATILNGQLASIDGVPLIVSEHFREDLSAAGVFDGVTTTQTGLVIVNRQEWAFGQRMALDVEVDDSIYRETFQRVVIGFMREDFQNIGDASTNDDTAYLRNLD